MKSLIFLVPLLLLPACKEAYDRESIYCSIDTPINGVVLPTTQDFSVGGWAFDELSDSSPEHVRVQFTSANGQVSKTFEASRSNKRPDVVKAFNKLGAEMSGFNLNVPANSLVPGKYKVVILQDMPKYAVTCDKNYIYEVVEKVIPVQLPVAPSAAVNAPSQSPVAPAKKSHIRQKKAEHSKE